MLLRKYISLRLWSIIILLFGLALNVACSSTSNESEVIVLPQGITTKLLADPPNGPLPVGQPIEVPSYSEDAQHGISHVELYVQLPSAEQETLSLLRADAPPAKQTSFAASQVFIPHQSGHYVIKVVGYNRAGENAESKTLGFDVQ